MSEWISVKDRLPEDDKVILLLTKTPCGQNDYFIGYRSKTPHSHGEPSTGYEWVSKSPTSAGGYVLGGQGGFLYAQARKVTHWMPLPEPPKEEK